MKNSADLGGCYPPRSSASVDNTLLDLRNSSYPTQPHSIIANLVACAQAVRFPSGSRVQTAPKFPILATFQAFYYTMKQRKMDSLNTLKTFKPFSLIAFGARNGLHQI